MYGMYSKTNGGILKKNCKKYQDFFPQKSQIRIRPIQLYRVRMRPCQKVPDPSKCTRLLGIKFHVMGITCLFPEKDCLFPGGKPLPELLRLSVKTAEIPLAVAPGGLPVLTGEGLGARRRGERGRREGEIRDQVSHSWKKITRR